MGVKWISAKTPGVRFYEHATRKYGVKFDRYFAIRYRVDGKRKEEGLGWASEGWTVERAAFERALLKNAHRTGEGPQTLAEKRQLENERRESEQIEEEQRSLKEITFSKFFEDSYKPVLQSTKKAGSVKAEKILFKKWIEPVIGEMPFKNIYPLHLEKIRKNMIEATRKISEGDTIREIKQPRSARSIEYVFAVVRQVWNMARRNGLIDRESPTRQIKLKKVDNKRVRFLSHDEADTLLKNLPERSKQLHDIALLSLHTGMRAGEIFALKWANLDLEHGLINIFDAKGGSRIGHMTEYVREMFQGMGAGGPNELVFENQNGEQIRQISNSFDRAVNDIGLNENVTDARQKVLFHTLRHTYASWLVQQGEPLYTVQKLMGHSTLAMTERYSHLAPDTLKTAVRNFEKNLNGKRTQAEVVRLEK